MIRTRECEQVITNPNTGKTYLFAGTFGFIRTLGLAQRDPALIHNDLMDGLLPPDEIKDAVKFSLEKIDGVDVVDANREKEAVEFIEEAGLIDSSIVARIVMSHAMNGEIKKKQMMNPEMVEKIQGMIIQPTHSLWMICTVLGLSLAGSISGLIALACMIFNAF